MKYFAQINSKNELIGVDLSKILIDAYDSTEVNNYEVAEEEFLKYKAAPYKYNGVEEKEIEEEIEVPDYDEEGNPIMIEYEDIEVVIDYDEEGNPTGTHEITVIKKKQQTHTETITETVWVLTENPDWEEEQLEIAQQAKYDEANKGAKDFLESGNALFEFEEGKHIEATDGNIAKLTAYALAYVTGQLQPTETVVWNTKEDETVELNAEQIGVIVKGLGFVQASVWSVQFPQYLQAIETAETIEEVNDINIEYYSDVPVGEAEEPTVEPEPTEETEDEL